MALILILDDSATNRAIFARLVTMVEDGVTAEVFADPLDALEWLEHNRVDLVITDFRMPGMDGATLTRKLRAIPGNEDVPVLVMTAHDDRSYRVRALDAGATDFLQSPIDHFEFVTRARNLLALGRQATDATARMPAPPCMKAGQASGLMDALGGFPCILDAMPAMISVVNREGVCLYANAAFAAACSFAPAEIPGTHLLALLGPERGAASRQKDLSVFASGLPLSPYHEVIASGADGRRVVATAKTPVRDALGDVAAVLTTSFDLPADSGPGG